MRHYSRAELGQVFDGILGELLPGVGPQAPHTESITQRYKIGSRLRGLDGVVWHYCQCGANGVAAAYRDRGMASLVTPFVIVSTLDVSTPPLGGVIGAVSAGATRVVIRDIDPTHGVDYWANGKVEFWNNMPGSTSQHRTIKSSTASTGVGGTVTLTLYRPLSYAIADNEGLEICRSIYAEVDQTDAVAAPARKSTACVPVFSPITALHYFWGQTWGMCTLAVGVPGGVMGAVDQDRDIYFQANEGTVSTTLNYPGIAAGATDSPQRAGFLLPNSAGGAQTIIMLQLDP